MQFLFPPETYKYFAFSRIDQPEARDIAIISQAIPYMFACQTFSQQNWVVTPIPRMMAETEKDSMIL